MQDPDREVVHAKKQSLCPNPPPPVSLKTEEIISLSLSPSLSLCVRACVCVTNAGKHNPFAKSQYLFYKTRYYERRKFARLSASIGSLYLIGYIQLPSEFRTMKKCLHQVAYFTLTHQCEMYTSQPYLYCYLFVPIMKTRLYNFDPLKPYFYIVKLGFTGLYIFFLFLLKNTDCGHSLEPPRRGGSNEYPQSMYWAEI